MSGIGASVRFAPIEFRIVIHLAFETIGCGLGSIDEINKIEDAVGLKFGEDSVPGQDFSGSRNERFFVPIQGVVLVVGFAGGTVVAFRIAVDAEERLPNWLTLPTGQ